MDDMLPSKEFQSTFIDRVGEASPDMSCNHDILIGDIVSVRTIDGNYISDLIVENVPISHNDRWKLYSPSTKSIIVFKNYSYITKKLT